MRDVVVVVVVVVVRGGIVVNISCFRVGGDGYCCCHFYCLERDILLSFLLS